jgi:hypothetical protein
MKIYHLATLNRSWAVGKMLFFPIQSSKTHFHSNGCVCSLCILNGFFRLRGAEKRFWGDFFRDKIAFQTHMKNFYPGKWI